MGAPPFSWPPWAAKLGDYTSSQITNLSNVAGATVTAALDTLAAGLVTQRNPIWDPPTVPSTDDDEMLLDPFNGINPTRGWTLALAATPAVPMTRDGEFNLTQTPAAGHFRSSCIGGTLFIQLRTNETVLMWKTLAGALTTSQFWFTGVGWMNEPSKPSVETNSYFLEIAKNNAGSPSINDRAIVRWQTGTPANPLLNERMELVTIAGGVIAPAVVSPDQPAAPYDGLVMRVDHNSAAANAIGGFPFRDHSMLGNGIVSNANTQAYNSATDKIVIGMRAQTAVPVVPGTTTGFFALHFLRRVPTSNPGLLAQA